jgi:hypothetical protein
MYVVAHSRGFFGVQNVEIYMYEGICMCIYIYICLILHTLRAHLADPFVVQQLLQLAQLLDYGDEMGRRQLHAVRCACSNLVRVHACVYVRTYTHLPSYVHMR